MLPVLFAADSTSWDSFGIGVLSDAISCTVEENRNGSYELEMTYPISGAFFDSIKLRCLIVAKPNYTDNAQPFRIYEISKPLNGIVTISAQHISYDLSGYVDAPFQAVGIQAALSKIKDASIVYPTSCPFTFTSDMSSTVAMNQSYPVSVRALIGGIEGSFIETYGGEWHFDRYACELKSARGANRGVMIRYGKNLTSLEQEENNASVYTAIYPYYYSAETSTLVVLPEKVLSASGTFGYTKVLPVDLTDEFEEAPTVAQLRAMANTYLSKNDIGVPKVNLTIGFVELDSLQERIDLCDTVSVRFDALGVSATAKCIRTKWDVLKGRYIEAELGSARNSLASTIAKTTEVKNAIQQNKSQFKIIAEDIASIVTGNSGGYIVLHDTNDDGEPDELLIMDRPDISSAVNVVRINNGGIAFSQTGYNGTYTTAWNINGQFSADFIATGELKANLVRIIGNTWFYWDTANITMVDPNNQNRIIRIGLYDGTNYGLGFSVDGGTTWTQAFTFSGLSILQNAGDAGYTQMTGTAIIMTDSYGVNEMYLGEASGLNDENGNVLSTNSYMYRIGTYTSTDRETGTVYSNPHGMYCVSFGRTNLPKGAYSIVMGYNSIALVKYCIAIGALDNVRSAYGIGIGYNNAVSGENGTSLGKGNTLTADNAIGIGISNVVSALNAIAMGVSNTASAQYALGVGNSNGATGLNTVAIGKDNTAEGAWAVAMGHGNLAGGSKSIAIGVANATSHVESVVIGNDNETTDTCAIMIGQSNGGGAKYSTSVGHNNITVGEISAAFGYYNSAEGPASIAIGRENQVDTTSGVAIGSHNTVGGTNYAAGITIGYYNESTNSTAVAIGRENESSGNSGVAIGYKNVVSGSYSIALGAENEVSANYGFASGAFNEVSGFGSNALGYQLLISANNYCTAVGLYNVDFTGARFIVGNGSSSQRSNAAYITGAGNMTIAGTLTQSSDARLKEVIDEDIPDVSGIRAKRFRWNDNKVEGDGDEHVGYIAQEVEEVAPQFVHDDASGYKTLDYIALLVAKVEQLENTVAALTRRVRELETI